MACVPSISRAQTATVDQQTPAQRCVLTQSYLQKIQKPQDLRARVDRLQAYRYIYQRIDVFVIRLEKNNQPNAKEMRTTLDQFNRATDAFKNDYEQYDQSREKLTTMKDCQNSIEKFQQDLQVLRTERAKLYQDILTIQDLLSPGISGQLETLQRDLQASEKTRANE